MSRQLSTRIVVSLWIAVVGACSLFTVSQAQATTIVCDSCSRPYQQWADESKMPTPELALTVIEDNSPCVLPGDLNPACTMDGSYTIWDTTGIRYVFFHELGHNFDFYRLQTWARERFLFLTEDDRPWGARPNGPVEHFAEAFAKCAMFGKGFRGDPLLNIKGNESGINRYTYKKICLMILNS